jgi:hemerythrin
MRIDWKDSYKIGNADIDEQHINLFEIINRFIDATDKESMNLCEMHLFNYTRFHFGHEEKLMQSIGYPDTRAHRLQHLALLSRLNEISLQIADDKLDLKEWTDFLSDWLTKHIATSDTKLAAFIKEG